MRYISRNSKLILWAWAIVALSCIGLAQPAAQAQSPVAGWPDKDYNQLNPVVVPFSSLPTVLHTGRFESDEEERKFTEYFNKSVFPNITHATNRQPPREDSAARRDDVITKLRYYLKSCENSPEKQVFEKLVDLTLAFMRDVAKDSQYHPAARVNAVLAIGEVNSPKAVTALLAILRDPAQFDAVRVAAMSGLVHLAGQSCMSDPVAAQPVGAQMVKIVRFTVPKTGSAQVARADGIRWMRGQAADVLGALKNPGPHNDVAEALLAMLNDKDLPIPQRCKAARALGKLDYAGNPPTPGPYLTAIAELASNALSSDQPADRARVKVMAREIVEGMKPFSSSLTSDQVLIEGLQKALQELNKDTDTALAPEELKDAITKAKEAIDNLLKNRK